MYLRVKEYLTVTALTCRLTEHSLEYVGDATMTEFMNDCLRAQDMIPSIYSTYEEKKRWFEERSALKIISYYYSTLCGNVDLKYRTTNLLKNTSSKDIGCP